MKAPRATNLRDAPSCTLRAASRRAAACGTCAHGVRVLLDIARRAAPAGPAALGPCRAVVHNCAPGVARCAGRRRLDAARGQRCPLRVRIVRREGGVVIRAPREAVAGPAHRQWALDLRRGTPLCLRANVLTRPCETSMARPPRKWRRRGGMRCQNRRAGGWRQGRAPTLWVQAPLRRSDRARGPRRPGRRNAADDVLRHGASPEGAGSRIRTGQCPRRSSRSAAPSPRRTRGQCALARGEGG